MSTITETPVTWGRYPRKYATSTTSLQTYSGNRSADWQLLLTGEPETRIAPPSGLRRWCMPEIAQDVYLPAETSMSTAVWDATTDIRSEIATWVVLSKNKSATVVSADASSDRVDWDFSLPLPRSRRGTIKVRLSYAGKGKPLPYNLD